MTAKPNRLLVTLVSALAVLSSEAVAAVPRAALPRLVVNILVDGLRSDYLEAFMPLYGDGGFRRLMDEGLVYTQAENPSAGADRAVSAATIATGTTPANHGIVGLSWMNRQTLRPVGCTGEADSPELLSVTTVGDELKVASDGKAMVVAVAPNREMAVLGAGHAADAAVWYDAAAGQWATSAYFGTLPAWARVAGSSLGTSAVWQPVSSLVGEFSYFLSGGLRTPFKHKLNASTFAASGLMNEAVGTLVQTLLGGTLIGQDDTPDYLSVGFTAVGPASMELQDTYVRLDRAIGRLIDDIEGHVGAGNVLIALTATGTREEDEASVPARHRLPGGTFEVKRSAGLLNMYLAALYGPGNYVEATQGTQLYLDHKLLESKQLGLTEVLERCQDFLLQLEGVKDVFTSQRLLQGAWTPGISRVRNAYNPRHSGDVLVEVAPGWTCVDSSQQSHQVRVSYIPFPIVFYGYGIRPERHTEPVSVDRIAPTLSAAMRIRAPNACDAKRLF